MFIVGYGLVASGQCQPISENQLSTTNFPAISGVYDFRRGDQRGVDPLGSVLVRWDKAAHDFVATSKPGGLPL